MLLSLEPVLFANHKRVVERPGILQTCQGLNQIMSSVSRSYRLCFSASKKMKTCPAAQRRAQACPNKLNSRFAERDDHIIGVPEARPLVEDAQPFFRFAGWRVGSRITSRSMSSPALPQTLAFAQSRLTILSLDTAVHGQHGDLECHREMWRKLELLYQKGV